MRAGGSRKKKNEKKDLLNILQFQQYSTTKKWRDGTRVKKKTKKKTTEKDIDIQDVKNFWDWYSWEKKWMKS